MMDNGWEFVEIKSNPLHERRQMKLILVYFVLVGLITVAVLCR